MKGDGAFDVWSALIWQIEGCYPKQWLWQPVRGIDIQLAKSLIDRPQQRDQRLTSTLLPLKQLLQDAAAKTAWGSLHSDSLLFWNCL